MSDTNIIHFDWAIKRLLRDKANFVVLEGFMQSLLGEKMEIIRILESEGNRTDQTDKYNKVDILAENSRNELVIIELQNTRELYYFQRMLYGVSKAITDYISLGQEYAKVRKIYSINIVYFDLGQGVDYIYHGTTVFTGVHTKDILKLSPVQQATFFQEKAGDLFPEYYILKVNEFNDTATTSIDEWIEYLKSGTINENTQAPGLKEAHERLQTSLLSKEELQQYYRHMDNLRIQWDVLTTAHIEGKIEGKEEGRLEGKEEGRAEGRAEGIEEGKSQGIAAGIAEGRSEEKIRMIRQAAAMNLPLEQIAQLADMEIGKVRSIIRKGGK